MKTFVIDYTRPDGRKDFKVVEAADPKRALAALLAAGIDGWTGYRFSEYIITGISERGSEA